MSHHENRGLLWSRQGDRKISFARPARTCVGGAGGLMVIEHYLDLRDDTGQIDVTAWRCTNCGEVIDEVILKNRATPAPNRLYGTKERTYAQQVERHETAGPESHIESGGAGNLGETRR